MKPNYRALLDEVADAGEEHVVPYLGHEKAWGEFLDRISAALATEPQKPTEEELTKLVRVFQSAYNAKRAELRTLPNPYRHDTESDMADHAGIRAVLALFPT
jgi:hypothetical protein